MYCFLRKINRNDMTLSVLFLYHFSRVFSNIITNSKSFSWRICFVTIYLAYLQKRNILNVFIIIHIRIFGIRKKRKSWWVRKARITSSIFIPVIPECLEGFGLLRKVAVWSIAVTGSSGAVMMIWLCEDGLRSKIVA